MDQRVPDDAGWDAIRPLMNGATFLLSGLDMPVLVAGLDEVPDDVVVVQGTVLFHGDHPDGGRLLVLDVKHIDEPYFDWA